MSTINYGGTNRNVYYVDATMSDNSGDGLTPQTAFKDLSASSLVNNSVYIFRRTPKNIYSTVTGGTASQIKNIIFMGMPLSTDKMYAIIPQEAKDTWNYDEEDLAEGMASVYFSSRLYLSSIEDIGIFRVRMLRNTTSNSSDIDNYCLLVAPYSDDGNTAARNLHVEKCEFTNVTDSLETTSSVHDINKFGKYIWYNCFNVSINDCDVEANETAFFGYSHISHFENIRALLSQNNNSSSSSAYFMIFDHWRRNAFSLDNYNSHNNYHSGTSFVKNINVKWRYNSSTYRPVGIYFASKNFSLENLTIEEAENHVAIPSQMNASYFIGTVALVYKMKNITINLPKEQGRGIFRKMVTYEIGNNDGSEQNRRNGYCALPIGGNYDRNIENLYIRYFNVGDDTSTFISNYGGTFDKTNFGTGSITSCYALFSTNFNAFNRWDYNNNTDRGTNINIRMGERTNEHDAGYIIAPYSFLLHGDYFNFEANEIRAGVLSIGIGCNIKINKLITTASQNIIQLNKSVTDNYADAWYMKDLSNCVINEIQSYLYTGSGFTSSAIIYYNYLMANIYVGKSNVRVVHHSAGLSRYGHCTITCANDGFTGHFISRSAYTTLLSWNTTYGGVDTVVLQFKSISGSRDRAWFGRNPFHLFGITPPESDETKIYYVKLRMSKVGFSIDRNIQEMIRMNVIQNGEKIGDSLFSIITADNNWHYGDGYNVYIPVKITANDMVYVDFNYNGNDETGTVLLHPEMEIVSSIPELEGSSDSSNSSETE